jgi:hypothetical protein
VGLDVSLEVSMRLKDVPQAPAYVVFHDAYDNGAMDVYSAESFEQAKTIAETRQHNLEQSGLDEGGIWQAYEKLPRKKVWSFHHTLKGATNEQHTHNPTL